VADPEFVGFGVATGRPLLLKEVDALALRPRHLGHDVAGARVADAEMANRTRLSADVERQDDGRVDDLALGIVVPDLRRILAEQRPVAGDSGLDVLHVEGDVERIRHGSSFSEPLSPYCAIHRPMSILKNVDAKEVAERVLCRDLAAEARAG